jgi:hypothetical protein
VSWYGSWWSGATRVKRKIAVKRTPGTTDGLTRAQAEKELRKRIERDVIVPGAARRTLEEAGGAYVDHLEHVMERKRSTIQDYRGHLCRHLVPFFGERPIDKIEPAQVAQYLKRKRSDGLSSKTVQNHLNFLHGVFAFAIKRGWAQSNPVAYVDRPKKNRSPPPTRPIPTATRAGQADRRRAGGHPRRDRAGAVSGRRAHRPAPGRAARAEVARHRLAGRARARGGQLHALADGHPQVPRRPLGPDGRRLARELKDLRRRSRFPADRDLVFCHPDTGHVLSAPPFQLGSRAASGSRSASITN